MVSSDPIKCSFSNNNNNNNNNNTQSQSNAFSNHVFETSTSEPVMDQGPASVPVSAVCRIDNSILSQALTSVIQKSDHNNTGSKDSNTIKSALQNAYLVDGNGLSDALKLIQSLHPEAKVTTQQYFLVNSGPQLVLSQAPPTQANSSRPLITQSPIKPQDNTANIHTPTSIPLSTSFPTVCDTNISVVNNSVYSSPSTVVFAKSTQSTSFNQSPVLSSTLSVLPQFSAFSPRPSNIYSLNSNFTNKLVNPIQNLGCRFTSNNINHYQSATMSTAAPICNQQTPLFVNQTPISSNMNAAQNTIGIRLQLAQNFPNAQHLNIIQPSHQGHVIPTLMNQPLQFLSPQHNNNISLITQTQPMSKLVLLYPNLNCSQIVSDIDNSMKTDNGQQQVILLSQPQKDNHQSTPISLSTAPTFQVLNGANIWQQLNPNLGALLGQSNSNNLVLMNPQGINNQSFSFNYNHASPLLTGSNFLMMSTSAHQGIKAAAQVNNNHSQKMTTATAATTTNNNNNNNNNNAVITSPISSLSINVAKAQDDDNLLNMKPNSSATNLNSNSSQNSCVEQLSNSSSSANSKLSFDDNKSSCQLSKSQSDNLTDSDQEKSINSPQFQMFNCNSSSNGDNNSNCLKMGSTNGIESSSGQSGHKSSSTKSSSMMHLTVDIDSLSPSNSFYHQKISSKSISSQNDDRNTIQSPDTDYDQSDFEIPCLYSHKFEANNNDNDFDN